LISLAHLLSPSFTLPQLPPTQPYKHYQIPGTPCFEQLFDAEEVAAFNRGALNVAPEMDQAAAWGDGVLGGDDDGEWEDLAGFNRLVIEDFDGPAGRRRWNGL